MRIEYVKSAVKALKKLDADRKRQIIHAVEGLIKEPPEGDIKSMQGSPGDYRLRIGSYRVIYRYEKEAGHGVYTILLVTKIGSRGDVYK